MTKAKIFNRMEWLSMVLALPTFVNNVWLADFHAGEGNYFISAILIATLPILVAGFGTTLEEQIKKGQDKYASITQPVEKIESWIKSSVNTDSEAVMMSCSVPVYTMMTRGISGAHVQVQGYDIQIKEIEA